MLTNKPFIEDASLCNSIHSKGYFMANTGLLIDRGTMISNYTQEALDSCWDALTINVIQNYQRGKGTVIKGFGTFTYKREEFNLEGTTNQYKRDKKAKQPVFIISKEFNSDCCPGECTKQNTIKYFIQKESKDIPLVKINYAEIAYSLSIPKDEIVNILSHLFKYLSESINRNAFKNKIMPGLGILICKNKILAVKFNDVFTIKNLKKNNTLIFTKKNVFLDMDIEKAQNVVANDCTTPYQNIENLKATNALITKCDKTADNYLKSNYDINVKNFPQHEIKNIYNDYDKNLTCAFRFINDDKKAKNSSTFYTGKINIQSPLFLLGDEILKTIEYYKGILIVNNKNYDINKSGTIKKEEAIEAILASNINSKIDYNIAKSIVDYYNKSDNVEYMKFIAQIVKESRTYLLKKMKRNNSTLQSIDYNSFRRENFFLGNDNDNRNNKKGIINNINLYKSFVNKETPRQLKKIGSEPSILTDKNCNTDRKMVNNGEEEEEKVTSYNNFRYIKNQGNFENKNKTINCGFFFNRHKETEEYKKKLLTILGLFPEIRRKNYTSLDQKISCNELINILKKYDVVYPKNKMLSMLRFLGIPDVSAFSLREFESYLKSCKIIESSIELSELNNIMKKLKDVIYINGGMNLFFNNEINHKDSLNCDTFIKILQDKVPYDKNTLTNVFLYLVKTDRNFNIQDFYKYFNSYNNNTDNDENNKINNNTIPNKRKNIYDETYFLNMMKSIIRITEEKHLKPLEYFNHLIEYNTSTEDKVISRENWIKYLQKEKLKFGAEEIDNLFTWIDTKKDEVLDVDEFIAKYNYSLKPLTILKDIINMNKLDIEDLAHRMKISIHELESYDYNTFRNKLKNLDYTLSDDFIKKIFEELKQRDENKNKDVIESKKFLDEINHIKPAENYKSFTQNYINVIKSKINYDNLKTLLEKFDKESLGRLTKLEYVSAISSIIPEFNDDDHMKFVRISDMFDKEGKVMYPELLNLIYYYTKENLNDPFSKLCQILSNILTNDCDSDIEKLMFLIETGVATKTTSLIVHRPLTINQVKFFLNKLNQNISNAIIQKLDIDADGLISFDDLKSVLKRFLYTSFFKYKNDSTEPNIDLFSKETLPKQKLNDISSKLRAYMKSNNITEIGLFKKFDKDEDGFISNLDFNQGIDEIIQMSPAIKDQFFNYLDFYHNGMVDLDTFVSRINNYDNIGKVVQNNNKIENEILEKIKEFITKNNKFSDNEIFQVMDKDCDGIINLDDFQKFITENLGISNREFNKSKLERVMMSISLSKNLQIGINDISEFINLCNKNKEHMNLKEVFQITANQNLSDLKKNKEWTNDIIERLGMFISQKYDTIEQFFEENSQPGLDKLKFSDFLNFHEKNYELFNNGFNLTRDELLSIFTSLDSQKKDYLTLQDLKNKLQIFDFYNKMHIDVRNFLQENFSNGIDAFKFFIKSKNDIEKNNENQIDLKCSITLKEFFDAFDNFFPNKYSTNTILKYLNKYFNINIPTNNKSDLLNKKETIDFREFNYVYFDKHDINESFINKKGLDTKLITNRINIGNRIQNKIIQKSQSNFYYSNLFKKKFDVLSTPFDNDPLDKIKRLICSTKYNLNNFFQSALAESKSSNYVVNKHQFKNIIRALNIGLTNLEIDQIIFKCGKLTFDGKINLKEFVKYLFSLNNVLEEGKMNVGKIIGEIKSLIYKYYSNPLICFQNNDIEHRGKMDFEKFKNMIFDLYRRNSQQLPNFILIKNAYDTIDLRKDGIIDINEWCKTFANYNGKLDVDSDKISNGQEYIQKNTMTRSHSQSQNLNQFEQNRKNLREWESSGDIAELYKFIHKNRKIIKNRIYSCNYIFDFNGEKYVQADNLLSIIKALLPKMRLSLTQWKMVVNIAKSETSENLIDINEFFRLMEITSKNLTSHPKIKIKNTLAKSLSDYSNFSNENTIKKLNQSFNKKRTYNLNKENKIGVNVINFDSGSLPYGKSKGNFNDYKERYLKMDKEQM